MKYHTENEFEHFDFSECYVKDIEWGNDYFHIWLDQVRILPENSCNRDIRVMRTNNLQFTIHEAKIVSFVREGVKIYNADGVPMGERDDETVSEDEYMEILPLFLEGMCYSVGKDKHRYTFILDAMDESTYELVIEGTGETEGWDRFMNLE